MELESTPHGHIAMIFHSFDGGGKERVFLDLADYYVQRGYRVDLVVGVKKGAFLGRATRIGARIVDLGGSRFRYVFPKMVDYLRRERPSVVLSGLTHVNLVTVLAVRLSGAGSRVVISERSILSKSIEYSPYWWERLILPFVRMIYPLADQTICISKGVAEDLNKLLKLDKSKVKVIYNPISLEEIDRMALEKLTDDYFNVDIPVILGVGRLEDSKDFRTLIRAFSLVRRQRPARLVILGEGSQRRVLQGLIDELQVSEDGRLMGFVANPISYMQHAKVFVLPSLYEGFGRVIIEALAVGTPVVATDCPSGPREILEDGKYGTLVPVQNPERLAEAICTTLDHPLPAKLLRERAEDFDINKLAIEYLETMGIHRGLEGSTLRDAGTY